jgi:1L-myo-inositol 1-phosphate cytidylyltransferase / CDP-L-myo-inositol myo-inositolphosphotransferase
VTPAVIRATAEQAHGAALKVAGLTVVERLARQLARQGPVRVMTDGTIPPPPGVEVIAAPPAGAAVHDADIVYPTNDLATPMRVVDEPSRRVAEDAVFAALLRGDLGVVARWLNKPISFRVTRYVLCRLPVTPNQVTVGAALVGLAGCALIALGDPTLTVLGFLLSHLQSVLDGCDGELARVRFQQSKIGEWLDTVVDDGLNVCLTLATGAGLWRARGQVVWLALGAAGAAMLATYSAVAYRTLLRQGAGGDFLRIKWWFNKGKDSKALASAPMSLSSLVYSLGRRDLFCFVWLVLAALRLEPLVLAYALAIATTNFVVAAGQVVTR